MNELKRCPFCGDEVEIVPTGLYHWKYAIHHKSKTECILDANAFVLPYEEDDVVRMWNTRADRKTENSSEKPNNCEICKHWEYDAKYKWWHCPLQGNGMYECHYEPRKLTAVEDEPTISKMEQVDKDINVRCKDEPQTDCPWK